MASLKFIQAQSFILQASGQAIGDTSIILQSFKMIDGTTKIVTADLGDKCYGTLEPNNGTQEEAIQFTGVTQNANGTATLTGVSSVGFNSPYTVTSGLAKSHAGGVTFILSNDAAFYGNIKTYIDTVVASGAAFADTTTAGITKMSVSPATGSNPVAVGDNDPRIPSSSAINYLNGIVQTGIPYVVATGTANAMTATLGSAVSSLVSGSYLNFLVPITNATAVTLNVNSLGAKTIKKAFSSSLASGDITIGQVAQVVYDGTNFQLLNPSSAVPLVNTYATGATWTKTPGLKYVIAEVVGGGGSGGATSSTGANSAAGAAGGYSRRTIPASVLGSTETVTVGGGGAARSPINNGISGGTSSFGSWCSASGGGGGVSGNGSGPSGGTGSNGDVNAQGQNGESGLQATGWGQVTSVGGNSYFGQTPGGGGQGVGSSGTSGAGSNGAVIVTEYY